MLLLGNLIQKLISKSISPSYDYTGFLPCWMDNVGKLFCCCVFSVWGGVTLEKTCVWSDSFVLDAGKPLLNTPYPKPV